jgi:hypothetical protein
MPAYVYLQYLSKFLEWEKFQTNFVEQKQTFYFQ